MRRIFICLLTIMVLFSSPLPGFCKDKDKEIEEEEVYVIQNRIFHKFHELKLKFGYVANDDFHNVFPTGGSYTYNFNDHISWEVGEFHLVFNSEKSVKKDLVNDFGVTISEFVKPKFFVHSNLIIRPFYGKESLFNKSIINTETYFLIGAGVVKYERIYVTGNPTSENALSINFGVGTKYFINDKFALNFEIRDMVNMRKDKNENYIYMGIGISYRFNMSPRKTRKNKDVERLQDYLK